MKQHSKKRERKLSDVPKKREKFNLLEMLSRMPKNYKVEEFPKTKPLGKEVW